MIRISTPHKALNIWDGERCRKVLGQSLCLMVWELVVFRIISV